MFKSLIFIINALILIGNVSADTLIDQEIQVRKSFFKQLVTVKGRVVDRSGMPLAATVQLAGFSATTDIDGFYSVPNIARKGHLLTITAAGYRKEIISISTSERPYQATVTLDPIILDQLQPNSVRLLFGGDVSFGRRFIDSLELTPRGKMPPDDPNALILVSDPLPGSKRVLQYIRPYYQAADWGSVNLETPFTDNPATPHPAKNYAFFSLPKSLPALSWLGVDYVGLGNNHIYDYLKLGLQDTLATVLTEGLHHSGAGSNNSSAIMPLRTSLKTTPYSFFAMTSVTGNEHSISYVATASKAGAADATDFELVEKSIKAETALGRVPIVQLHGGVEYSQHPSTFTKETFEMLTRAGASLVVGHHPHVAQGIGMVDGIVNIHSLGNLAFDQDRLETMLGITARVDMRGKQVDSVRLLPHYLEDYRPRPINGNLANFLIKRIAERSRPYNGFVYPYNNQGWVSLNKNDFTKINRPLNLTITVPSSGSMILDLRKYQKSHESLAQIFMAGIDDSASLKMGRDLMEHHGDIEDYDIDEQNFEAERWDTTNGSGYICVAQGYSGIGGLCSTRNASNITDSVIPFRNRTRIFTDDSGVANKDVTFFSAIKSVNAGKISVIARYYASEGVQEFGEEIVYKVAAGNDDWREISAPLHMPADDPSISEGLNPHAFRFFLRMSPPAKGEAKVIYDNIAAIAWENSIVSGEVVSTPHVQEFIKIVAKPGAYKAKLVFSSYKPKFKN